MATTIRIVYNNFGKIARALPRETGRIVDETLSEVETTAKAVVPVDTGALRDSIQKEKTSQTSGMVYTNKEYCEYVEFGTSKMAAQPYMTPAAEIARPHFMAKMRDLESRLG